MLYFWSGITDEDKGIKIHTGAFERDSAISTISQFEEILKIISKDKPSLVLISLNQLDIGKEATQ